MIRILFILLLLASSAMGRQAILDNDSLPYIVNSNDTITFDSSWITVSNHGIYIEDNADNVYIYAPDGEMDTLEFGTGNGDSLFGVRIGRNLGAKKSVIIKNIFFYHGGDSLSYENDCIQLAGPSGLILDTVGARLYGQQGNVIESEPPDMIDYVFTNGTVSDFPATFKNVVIRGGTYTNDAHGSISRCQYNGSTFRLTNSRSLSAGDSTITVIGTTILNSPGQGIVAEGLAIIRACSITVDMRNSFYTYTGEAGSGNACFGVTNSAAILTQDMKPGSYMGYNYIRAGDNHQGCDVGILMQFVTGTADSIYVVEYNDVEIHAGRDQYYWNITSKAFKSRYQIRYARVENNRFVVWVADTLLQCTTSEGAYDASFGGNYGARGCAVILLDRWDDGCQLGDCSSPDSFYVFRYNEIELAPLQSNYDQGIGVRFGVTNDNGYDYTNAGCEWYGNTVKAPEWVYRFSEFDWGSENMLVKRDTLRKADSLLDPASFTHFCGFFGPGMGNMARDCIYENGASDTNIGFWNTETGDRSIFIQRTVTIQVDGGNKSPIKNAACSLWNNYDKLVLNGLSDVNGEVTGVVNYWYEAEDTPDSTDYNDFNGVAWFEGNSGVDTVTVGTSVNTLSIEVSGATGEGQTTIKEGVVFGEGTVIKP